jgi:hypothetical protein
MVEYRINVINPEIGTVETHIFTKEDFTNALKKNSFIRGNTQQTFAALHSLMYEVIKKMTDDNVKLIGDYICAIQQIQKIFENPLDISP